VGNSQAAVKSQFRIKSVMFGLINRGSLPSVVEDEFEHLMSRLRALWLVEHDENGKHTDITAQSITVSGDSTFESDATIDGELEVASEEVLISDHLGDGEDGLYEGPGISMNRVGNGLSANRNRTWDLFVERNGNAIGLGYLAVYDRTAGKVVGGWRRKASNGAYEFCPHDDAKGTPLEVNLGSRDDGSDQGEWDNIYGILGWLKTRLDVPQIAFPATQQASSDANTLDDYEEGTWTPGIGGSGGESGQTYAANGQVGHYIKIGRLVTATLFITLTAKGTITGSVEITGLPFASINSTNAFSGNAFGQWNNLATNWVNIWGLIIPNTSRIRLRGANAAAANNATDLVTADINNNSTFLMTFSYFTQS